MVRPEHFDFNYETAENNHFQKKEKKLSKKKILRITLKMSSITYIIN